MTITDPDNPYRPFTFSEVDYCWNCIDDGLTKDERMTMSDAGSNAVERMLLDWVQKAETFSARLHFNEGQLEIQLFVKNFDATGDDLNGNAVLTTPLRDMVLTAAVEEGAPEIIAQLRAFIEEIEA